MTYDRNASGYRGYEYFAAEVAGTEVLWAMKQAGDEPDCGRPPTDIGWQVIEADLSTWRGQAIEIRFLLHTDDEYNTWVYIDDISVR